MHKDQQFSLVQDDVHIAPAKGRVCPKCSYARTLTDTAPAWQCPRCEVAYDKAMPASVAKRAEARRPRDVNADDPNPVKSSGLPMGLMVLVIAVAFAGFAGWRWRVAHPGATELAARAEARARADQVGAAQAVLSQASELDKADQMIRQARSAEGLSIIARLAEQGDTRAMVRLGMLYRDGVRGANGAGKANNSGGGSSSSTNPGPSGVPDADGGLPKSHEQAMVWLNKAAAQGEPMAFVNIAYIFEEGMGVEPQIEYAANWYQKAAKQGNASGLYSLGKMHAVGYPGVPQSPVLAHMLLDLASREYNKASDREYAVPHNRGAFWATGDLRRLQANMSAADIANATKLADAWTPGFPFPAP